MIRSRPRTRRGTFALEPVDAQGAYFQQAAWVYGETRYTCPTTSVAGIYADDKVPSWAYRWNTQDPGYNALGLLVVHTAEIYAIWGPDYTESGQVTSPKSYYSNGTNAAIVAEKERNLGLLLGALELLYESWVDILSKDDLNKRSWGFYVRVRPEVAQGTAGWGGKGEVKLADVLELRRPGT